MCIIISTRLAFLPEYETPILFLASERLGRAAWNLNNNRILVSNSLSGPAVN
jgi:hypothetical protein